MASRIMPYYALCFQTPSQTKLNRLKTQLDLLLLYNKNKQTLIVSLLQDFLLASISAIIGFIFLAFSVTEQLSWAGRIWPAAVGVAIGILWRAFKLAGNVVYIDDATASLRRKIDKIERKQAQSSPAVGGTATTETKSTDHPS